MSLSIPKPQTNNVTLPAKSIHEILSDPESLMALSTDDLKKLLEPYIPATRHALLPEEKPSKLGLHSRVMKDFFADPRIAEGLARLKDARLKGTK